jgi:hypothetical protein
VGARDRVVELVERHQLPGLLEIRRLGARLALAPRAVGQGCLGGHQVVGDGPRALLAADAADQAAGHGGIEVNRRRPVALAELRVERGLVPLQQVAHVGQAHDHAARVLAVQLLHKVGHARVGQDFLGQQPDRDPRGFRVRRQCRLDAPPHARDVETVQQQQAGAVTRAAALAAACRARRVLREAAGKARGMMVHDRDLGAVNPHPDLVGARPVTDPHRVFGPGPAQHLGIIGAVAERVLEPPDLQRGVVVAH